MLKKVFAVFFCFLSFHSFSQQLVSSHPASFNHGLLKHIQKQNNPNEILNLLVKGNGTAIETAVAKGGGTVKYNIGDIYAIRIQTLNLNILFNTPGIDRIEGYSGTGKILDVPVDSLTHADSVKKGAHPLPQPYTGKGVVMGFLDVGIDITQPDFMTASGRTRIKYLWNQNDTTGGTTPTYGYGQEWDSSDINNGTCTSVGDPSFFGHGTNVAGAGCGNGHVNSIFTGVAPEADIISVTCNFGDNFLNDLVDATHYIYDRANQLGEPCSINCSVGTYSGTHDGQDLPGQAVAALIAQQNGRSFSCASGDAGGTPIHLGYTVQADSAYCWFKNLLPSTNQNLVVFELFANKSQFDNVHFQLGADLPSPTFSKRGHTRYYNIPTDFNLITTADSLKDSLYVGPNRIGLISLYVNLVEDSVYDIVVEVVPDSTNYLWRFTTKGSGYFDCWTNVNLTGTSNILKAGLPTVSNYPDIAQYRLPDFVQGLVSSYACSDKVLTVGNYIDRTSFLNYYNMVTAIPDTVGAYALSTSVGPTRDGRVKPEIISPGANIMVPGQLDVIASYIANSQGGEVAYGSENYNENGGTSLASPIVAGIIAMYFERYPDASWAEVKQAIESSAIVDNFTGSNLPNIKWGYGKVNAFGALNSSPDSLATAATIAELVNQFAAYPNPASGTININYELTNISAPSYIQITDLSGRNIDLINLLNGHRGYSSYNMEQLAQGVYLFRLINSGKTISTLKILKL